MKKTPLILIGLLLLLYALKVFFLDKKTPVTPVKKVPVTNSDTTKGPSTEATETVTPLESLPLSPSQNSLNPTLHESDRATPSSKTDATGVNNNVPSANDTGLDMGSAKIEKGSGLATPNPDTGSFNANDPILPPDPGSQARSDQGSVSQNADRGSGKVIDSGSGLTPATPVNAK